MAIRTEEWRLIEFLDGRYELYDLRADPHESVNLAAQRPERLEALRSNALGALAERYAIRPETVPVDTETLRKLKALGYVE